MKLRSKFEAKIAAQFARAKVKVKYESQKIPYVTKHVYNTDWELPNGVIIETKGYFKGRDRTKHLLVKKQHPDKDIRFVFEANNKLSPSSDTRYGDWCDKHGFLWAVGEVPEAWIKEKRRKK